MTDCKIDCEASPDAFQEIREAIRKKYASVSLSAANKFQYPTGKDGANTLGYPSLIYDFPEDLLESFCGVGNPFSLGKIHQGNWILDVGCGAGLDMIVASRLTGSSGKVFGIDITREMVTRARENLIKASASNAEIKHIHSEDLPFDDNIFDIVISNGVINLSPCKQTLFKEIYRILKPGGSFQFADIMLERELPANLVGSLEAWSQ